MVRIPPGQNDKERLNFYVEFLPKTTTARNWGGCLTDS
jgi:hypothetical protein